METALPGYLLLEVIMRRKWNGCPKCPDCYGPMRTIPNNNAWICDCGKVITHEEAAATSKTQDPPVHPTKKMSEILLKILEDTP